MRKIPSWDRTSCYAIYSAVQISQSGQPSHLATYFPYTFAAGEGIAIALFKIAEAHHDTAAAARRSDTAYVLTSEHWLNRIGHHNRATPLRRCARRERQR